MEPPHRLVSQLAATCNRNGVVGLARWGACYFKLALATQAAELRLVAVAVQEVHLASVIAAVAAH